MPTRDVSKVIEVKNVYKAFGDNQVLSNASLTVHRGEVISVRPMGGDALVEVTFAGDVTKKLMLKSASAHMKKV